MSRTYYRPLSLAFGRDAAVLIASGRAGALGGMTNLSFSHVEVLSRKDGHLSRSIETYGDVSHEPALRAITTPRPTFGGVGMDRTCIMGIVNVTPDSFSDGGQLSNDAAAIAHGRQLAEEGADILDIGGESTRPGSETVSVSDELSRVEAVIAELARDHVVSADTRKSAIMATAIKAGAKIINDVSALGHDADSAAVVAQAKVPVILMHAQGEPKTMQLNPRYEHVLLDVYDALRDKVDFALAAGIARENICVDPGIGFGKTFKQNLELMAGLTLFHGLGVPVLVGLSRKGFIGAVTGEKTAADRIHGSVGGAIQAALAGAHILRVHDVKATVAAVRMFTASGDPDSVDL